MPISKKLAIRLARHGCTNRPFFHIVVIKKYKGTHGPVLEQVGTFDPMPNERNEKLVAFNYDRIQYWIGKAGAEPTTPIRQLLGRWICPYF